MSQKTFIFIIIAEYLVMIRNQTSTHLFIKSIKRMKQTTYLNLLLITLLIVLVSSFTAYSQTTISGNIKNPDKEGVAFLVKLDLDQGAHSITDTLKVDEKGNYTIQLDITEPVVYVLSVYRQQNAFLVLEPKQTLTANFDGTAGGQVEVQGSEDSELLLQFQQKQTMLQEQYLRPAMMAYQEAQQSKDQEAMEKAIAEYEKQQEEVTKQLYEFIKTEMKNSIAAFATYIDWNSDNEMELMREIADNVEKVRPNLSITKAVRAKIERLSRFAIGSVAPDIKAPTPDDKEMSLSDLRGKYVLLDFWAAWCGPCRQENPNVVRVFQKYKDKGFTVFGVSLDNAKDKWLKAIETDQLTWSHISDLKGWQSEPAAEYGVRSIPANYLLDPEGRIIAKDLRGAALEAKMAEIFAK